MNDDIKRKIGYEDLIEQLLILSPYGKERLNKLELFTSKEELIKEYQLIEIFINNLSKVKQIEIVISKLKNILPTINNCEKGFVLNIVELYEVKMQAIQMDKLKELITNNFDEYFYLEDCSKIISLLSDRGKITYDFYLYDSYSEKLRNYRLDKRKIEKEINNRNEKDIDNLQEQRAKIVSLEKAEEEKVKKYLSLELRKLMSILKHNIKIISHIDLLIAKAKLAVKYKGVKPQISSDKLIFKGMNHPLIKKNVEEKKLIYTKNNIELESGTTILTGANMSGKSSILKTLALNVYLGLLGFYVFADYAEIPLVKGIKYLGTEINEIHGYSNFGQEIISLNEIIKEMKKERLLICVDEFARTTNPNEGEKFVRALANFAQKFSSFTIIATHYDGIPDEFMGHYQIKGLKDFEHISSDDILGDFNRYMDYTLEKVAHSKSVPQEAYKVCVLLNIDKDFKQVLDNCYEE